MMNQRARWGLEVTLSSRGVKNIGKFIFKRDLPEVGVISSHLCTVASRLGSFGYADFSDKKLVGPATHLLGKSGKLLRPALVFAGAYVLNEEMTKFVDLAIASELLHVASLIHDDVIDGDAKRRGLQTVHVRYGREAAIVAGDALIAKAVELGSEYGKNVMKAMAKSSMDMCAGELLDYECQNTRTVPDLKLYTKIARLKSASSIANSFSAAAIYKEDKAASGMQRFGRNLGIAFQIRDDIIETIDLEESKKNGTPNEPKGFKPNIVRTMESKFGKDSALERAIDLNNDFASKAEECAEEIGISKDLLKYVDFVRVRSD